MKPSKQKRLKNFNRALKNAERIVAYYDECREHGVALNQFERMQARVADQLLKFAPRPTPGVPEDVDADYEDFWRALVENPDGSLNVAQVKLELSDFHKVMRMVPKVYDHITGGVVSKIMTDPDVVIALADDHFDMVADDDICEAVNAATADAWCDNQAMRLMLTAVIEDAKFASYVLTDFADCVSVDQIARRLDSIIAMAGPGRHEEYQYPVALCRLKHEVSLFGQFAAEAMAYMRDGCTTHQRMAVIDRLKDIVVAGMRCDSELVADSEGREMTHDWFRSTGATLELKDTDYFVTWKDKPELWVRVALAEKENVPVFHWTYAGVAPRHQPQDIPGARILMLGIYGQP